MRSYRKSNSKRLHKGDYETAFREEEKKWYQPLLLLFRSSVSFWILVFSLLAVYLQKKGAFHFYYIEQEQLFLNSKAYFWQIIREPAGFVRLIAEYCIQFFVHPYAGPLIMSAWLTAIAMLTARIIRKISPASNLFLFSLLPLVLLLYVHFDTNYFYKGTVAYCFMLVGMWVCLGISQLFYRFLATLFFAALLFWSAGSIAFLFTVCVFLRELLTNFSRAYVFLVPIGLVLGLSAWCMYSSQIGDYRFLLLPDGYYNYRLRPGIPIYLSWLFMPFILILCRLLKNREPVEGGRKFMEITFQLVLVGLAFGYGMRQYVKPNSEFYKELDHYMRTEQWDLIIQRCEGDLKNYLYKTCLNVALAEKGMLADRMFAFDQSGVEGICLPWNRQPQVSILLSDVYFSMGHIALSQRMAFEANVSYLNANPRMLKRLIQTNLIYGAYPVAEKYISILEQTTFYRKWAMAHRRFLWDDLAVKADSLLGMKQNCIPANNLLSETNGLAVDLKNIAEQNPGHRSTIEYLGALFLLDKDMNQFYQMLKTYYGTDVLPVLPSSFQEGVIILSEQEPAYRDSFQLSNAIVSRYNEYRSQVLANKNNTTGLPGLLKRSYGDTYWYYYMFE